jgi:AbrB family looped-hinge helix DNA binding protein
METTRLSSKGQIVLPKALRQALGWTPGTVVVVERTAKGVLLSPKKLFPPTTPDQVFGRLRYRGTAKTLEQIDQGWRVAVKRKYGDRR